MDKKIVFGILGGLAIGTLLIALMPKEERERFFKFTDEFKELMCDKMLSRLEQLKKDFANSTEIEEK